MLIPSILLPMYKACIRPHIEFAIQASSPNISRGCHALESVQKPVVVLLKGLRHVPYETALQRLRLFSIVRRRIRGDFVFMYKIMRGLLDFPCVAVSGAPTRIGLRGHTFNVHQKRCKTRRRQQCVQRLTSRVLEQTASEDCHWMPDSSPSSQKFPSSPTLNAASIPCRTSSVCYYCNYSWSSIVVFSAH